MGREIRSVSANVNLLFLPNHILILKPEFSKVFFFSFFTGFYCPSFYFVASEPHFFSVTINTSIDLFVYTM